MGSRPGVNGLFKGLIGREVRKGEGLWIFFVCFIHSFNILFSHGGEKEVERVG